jgi:hypothetical protein
VPENPGALNLILSPMSPALTKALIFGSIVGIVFTSAVVAAVADCNGATKVPIGSETATETIIAMRRLRFTRSAPSKAITASRRNLMSEG